MAIISFNRKRDNILNDFARKYRDRTLSYLHNAFSLRLEDCEDVFQEASIVLYNAAVDGKLDDLKSSLYTYFIGICKNKARELMRANGKIPMSSIDEFNDDKDQQYSTILNKADRILNDIDTDEKSEQERNNVIHNLIKGMTSPCNELLWSYYRDALSMSAIAKMFNYASESVAKVTKHRCMEKFRKSYEMTLSIM